MTPAKSTSTIVAAPRRGLSRTDAANYVGVGPSKFDELVADGRMPPPRRIDGRKVWDVRELDISFEDLPHDPGTALANSWDDR
jgi:predicted DNA-binding transcriptional regulator AlpA